MKSSQVRKIFAEAQIIQCNGSTAVECAQQAAAFIWEQAGEINGMRRASLPGGGEPWLHSPAEYRGSWMVGYARGLRESATKAGVKAALIAMGHTEFPNALKETTPSKDYIMAEKEFAEYLVADTDFGGAWNDDAQINMHLK